MIDKLIPRTPEAEAEHQKFLKRCQGNLFLTSAIKGLIDAWLVSDGEDTEKLSFGVANVAKPIIEKTERERIVELYTLHHGTQSPANLRRIMLGEPLV